MSSKGKVAVSVKKPKLVFLVLINMLTAVCAQGLFVFASPPLFQQIFEAKGLSNEDFLRLINIAFLLNLGVTIFFMLVMAVVIEKSLNDKDLLHREVLRAWYFSMGILIVVVSIQTFDEKRPLQSVLLAIMLIATILLGRYRLKFKEARQGIWFPHTIFHFALQQLILFPFGLKLISNLAVKK